MYIAELVPSEDFDSPYFYQHLRFTDQIPTGYEFAGLFLAEMQIAARVLGLEVVRKGPKLTHRGGRQEMFKGQIRVYQTPSVPTCLEPRIGRHRSNHKSTGYIAATIEDPKAVVAVAGVVAREFGLRGEVHKNLPVREIHVAATRTPRAEAVAEGFVENLRAGSLTPVELKIDRELS